MRGHFQTRSQPRFLPTVHFVDKNSGVCGTVTVNPLNSARLREGQGSNPDSL